MGRPRDSEVDRRRADSAERQIPLEVEVNLSRSQWLDDVEIPVTNNTPDPLDEERDDSSPSDG
jgi:hypothetical protein